MNFGNSLIVISPHLDDAVWSCGGVIAEFSDATVLTVFAGDPFSHLRAGDWDQRSGFRTIGGASRARRAEDNAACEVLGAKPVHLPYLDSQYGDDRRVGLILSDLHEYISRRDTVLVPGWPLTNPDHWWAAALGLRAARDLGKNVFLYAEEPYRTWSGPSAPGESPLAPHDVWESVPVEILDRRRKLAAMNLYGSQLPLLLDHVPEAELGQPLTAIISGRGDSVEWYAKMDSGLSPE